MSMANFFKDLKPYTAYQHVSPVSHVAHARKSRDFLVFFDTCSPAPRETCEKIDVSTAQLETCSGKDVALKDIHVSCQNPFHFAGSKTFETCATYETCDFEHIQYEYEERAAILEFEGKLSKAEAEAFAHDALLVAFVTEQHGEVIKTLLSL